MRNCIAGGGSLAGRIFFCLGVLASFIFVGCNELYEGIAQIQLLEKGQVQQQWQIEFSQTGAIECQNLTKNTVEYSLSVGECVYDHFGGSGPCTKRLKKLVLTCYLQNGKTRTAEGTEYIVNSEDGTGISSKFRNPAVSFKYQNSNDQLVIIPGDYLKPDPKFVLSVISQAFNSNLIEGLYPSLGQCSLTKSEEKKQEGVLVGYHYEYFCSPFRILVEIKKVVS